MNDELRERFLKVVARDTGPEKPRLRGLLKKP